MKRRVLHLSVEEFRRLLASARWALREVWAMHPSLVIGLVLVTLMQGVLPAVLALTIRSLTNVAVHAAEQQGELVTSLLPWLVLTFVVTVAEAVGGAITRLLIQRAADDVELNITSKVLAHAARLDVAFFEDPRFQDIIDRAQHKTASHFSRLLSDILSVVTQLVQTILLAAVLAAIEPLVMTILVPLPLVQLWVQWRLSKEQYLAEAQRTRKRRWSHYFVSLLTGRQTVAEVKLLGLAPILIDRFRALMIEFRNQNRRIYFKSFTADWLFAALTTSAFFAMLVRVFARYIQGSLLVGDVVAFGTVTLRLRGTIESLVWSTSRSMEHALYISNLQEFLSIEPRIKPTAGLSPSSSKGEIEFRNVSFAYPGADRSALSDVSFRIEPGETVALVGKNGAGKTTLVKLLARFYDPEAGAVLFDGIDVRELSLEYLHRQIAFVFQRHGPYEATALENIAYGDWGRLLQDRERVRRIAEETGVNELIERMPQGYDTLLGRRFGEYDLSDGQWQQLAIARAFARDARLLILDEPTAHLDAMAEYELFDRTRQLASGKTTILISHRFSTVRMADRILVLDQGRIVEAGTHRELVAQQGHYAKLYEIQQRQMEVSLDL
jgi:ATP-binding cassette subfamily B protein